jgi:hypothetical protein
VGTHGYPCLTSPRSTCRRRGREEVTSKRDEDVTAMKSRRVHGDPKKKNPPGRIRRRTSRACLISWLWPAKTVSQAQASHSLAATAQVGCLISLQQLSQVQPFLCLICTQEPGPTINYHQPPKGDVVGFGPGQTIRQDESNIF